MIIIYEGPDGIGKNAFIAYEKALREKVIVFEYNKDFGNTFNDWALEIEEWKKYALQGMTVLVSRCWLSENLYAPVFNRDPRMTLEEEANLTLRLSQLNDNELTKSVILILLPKDSYAVYARLVQRGDDKAVIDNWYTIHDTYKTLDIEATNVVKRVYI